MKNFNNYSKEELYQIFLNRIDDLSKIRLDSIDNCLSIYKMKFTNLGFVLTETSCYNKRIMIKRNQNGFYVDERDSLMNEDNLKRYKESLEFLKNYNKELELIDNLLKDKEAIMNGYYQTSLEYETDLEIITKILGYGNIRKEEITEENPIHPSDDYKFVISIIEKSKDEKNYKDLKNEILSFLQNKFKHRYELRIKTKKEQYGYDFDPEYGILIIDKETNEMHMLYGVTEYAIYKDNYQKYAFIASEYLEICLEIIVKCIK